MRANNNIIIKGRLYNFDLNVIETEKGEAIGGSVTLEANKDGSTVEARFFAYPKYSSGKNNKTYSILDDMMNGKFMTVSDDDENADWLELTGTVDISYFAVKSNFAESNELARAQKIRGSFLNPNKRHQYENQWKTDLYITEVEDVEADEEKGYDRYVKVTGYIVDDYNKRILPMITQAHKPAAINYIIGLPASEDRPYAVSTWGQLATLTTKVIKKNAFDEDEVQEFENKKWVITGMNPDPYDFGDESVMTEGQWKEYKDNFETYKQAQLDKANNNKPRLPF